MKNMTSRLKLPEYLKVIWTLLKTTAAEWSQDGSPRMGAALAFYTMFSLAPLLIIAVGIIGLVYGREEATNQLLIQIEGFVGEVGAATIQTLIQKTSLPSANIIASLIGLGALLLGASGVFGQLQHTLNVIWNVEPKPSRGLIATIKSKLFSFCLVLGSGFLLLVSLAASGALSALGNTFLETLPSWKILAQVLNTITSIGIVTLLFALLFKYVPETEVAWADVWFGAFVTALLFSIGQSLISFYIGYQSFSSTYGAAASLVVILLWVYYSTQIMFFGAKFTKVYADTFGTSNNHGIDKNPSEKPPVAEEAGTARQV